MNKISLLCLSLLLSTSAFSQKTIVQYLSGTDKDHTVNWDFYCSEGRKSGQWYKIPVPSQWETHGFGNYNYGHDKVKATEQGRYKTTFTAQPSKGKRTFIVFEGVMRDTKVTVNGKQAGDIHQGSFYRFKYDITDLVKSGENQLEVTVDKVSANPSVNKAENGDYWIFGGIYRPVYLEITPSNYIDRLAVNATEDGSFKMNVYAPKLKGDERIVAQVQKLNGEKVGKPISIQVNAGADFQQLSASFNKPLKWNAEYPNLYEAVVSITNKNGAVVHSTKQKFGFRTVELRKNDGVYVNGKKIIMKGVNRHSFWPESGRTLSREIHMMDVKAMKDMNMNAVRMSHYPPDQEFLDICDSVGLYVLDELTGWQANYDTNVGRKLVKEVVVRDVNHPSILFWDNGNEGGFNRDLDNDYRLYDPQDRVVIHPWEKFNGSNTKHYPDYNYVANTLPNDKEGGVYFPTEFMHGLYDGGAGAGLEDFWNAMLQYPANAGGFIWVLGDEALIRTDKNNAYDADGNHAPDGIVGPHREKEASYYTIKEIWSPIYITPQPIDADFDGKIAVENRYSFTDLSTCTFKWKLVKFPSAAATTTAATIVLRGTPAALSLAPGARGTLDLKLPANWPKNDALYLSAYDRNNNEVFTWSWPITAPANLAKTNTPWIKMPIAASENANQVIMSANRIKYYFDKNTGYISKVVKGDKTISLSNGPVLAGVETKLKRFTHRQENGSYIIDAVYNGDASLQIRWTFAWGKAVQLQYSYKQTGDVDFHGITFNYPEKQVTGMRWLGRGPYKVWKNRLRGQQFGVWHKAYNNGTTGEKWDYPEFKGYYQEVNWVTIENKESPFTVYSDDKNTFLQMYKQDRANQTLNRVEPPMPAGNISFLQGISAIGTKFQEANQMGPQSQKNKLNGDTISGTLWFEF